MKGYSAFPKAPALPSDCFVLYQDSCLGDLPLNRKAVSVLCSLSGLGHATLIGEVWPFTREAVGVLCSLRGLGHWTLIGVCWGSDPSAEKQSFYRAASANWATGRSSGKSYPSAEKQSIYCAALADCTMNKMWFNEWRLSWKIMYFSFVKWVFFLY